MNPRTATTDPLMRVRLGTLGSIEVPVAHRTTVQSSVGKPLIFRLMFGYSVVAVTGGPALADVVAATDNTFAEYVNRDARWDRDHEAGVVDDDLNTRTVVREFTWTENDYLPMSSIVVCLSDDSGSMIVHGSCATKVGSDELAILRRVVESARLF